MPGMIGTNVDESVDLYLYEWYKYLYARIYEPLRFLALGIATGMYAYVSVTSFVCFKHWARSSILLGPMLGSTASYQPCARYLCKHPLGVIASISCKLAYIRSLQAYLCDLI
jgi:hypothetical protein